MKKDHFRYRYRLAKKLIHRFAPQYSEIPIVISTRDCYTVDISTNNQPIRMAIPRFKIRGKLVPWFKEINHEFLPMSKKQVDGICLLHEIGHLLDSPSVVSVNEQYGSVSHLTGQKYDNALCKIPVEQRAWDIAHELYPIAIKEKLL